MIRVINIKRTTLRPDQYVYIGRPSKWGNPYSHLPSTLARFRVTNRTLALMNYEVWIREQPMLLAALPELDGAILGCHCKPLNCHGDILIKLFYELVRP